MPSILEKFGISFNVESEALKKGLKDVEKQTKSTKDKLSKTDKIADDLGKSFQKMVKDAALAVAGITSLAGITAGVISTAIANRNLDLFSQSLGLNMQDVQAWGDAVARQGGSLQGFEGVIGGLTKQLQSIPFGGGEGLLATLAQMGISAFNAQGKLQNVFDLLPQISEALAGMPKGQAIQFGARLGLDQGTLLLLEKGPAQVNELIKFQKKLGQTTNVNAEASRRFSNALLTTRKEFRLIFGDIGDKVLPVMSDLLDSFNNFIEYLRQHKGIVEGFFAVVATGLGLAFGAKAIGMVLAMVTAFKSLAIFEGIALAPLLLVIAAIAALAFGIPLLIDDFETWREGGKSLIGEFLNEFPKVNAVFDALGDAINYVISKYGEFIKIKNEVGDALSHPMTLIKKTESYLGHKIEGAFHGITSSLPELGRIPSPYSNASSTNNSVSYGDISINTQATDSSGLATEIHNKLNDHANRVIGQFSDGIKR